jgi:DNA-binding beta-propeller fold protein YncE
MKARSLVYVVVCACFLAFGALVLASPPAAGYHLLKKIPLGAAPGGGEYFDYITFDAPSRRVYLSHGTEIKVIDADSYEVVGTISGLKRSHGVAIVRDLNKGFITDGDAEKVLVFDLKTFKITGEIKSYPDTDSIVYDPASKLIFTFNGDSKNSTVIDPAKDSVVKAIDLGGAVEFPVADGKGMVYDNNEEKNDVVAIDTKTLTVKARWPVAPAGTPVAMAMDRQHRRLFSSGRGPQMLVIMDADNGKVVQSFPISAGVDANVFEPETGMLFVSTREGKIHIYHEDTPDKFSEVETVTTEYGAKTMAVDPKTHNLFLTTSDFGQPPAATKERPNPQRPPTPGTFRLLVYGK